MDLSTRLRQFGATVQAELPQLFERYAASADDGPCFVDQPGQARRVRPNCDAVEIAAMFDTLPPGRSRAGWVELLGSCQDPVSGLVGEHLAADRRLDPPWGLDEAAPLSPAPTPSADTDLPVPSGGPDRYNTMAVNYALECLGAHLPGPVHEVGAITAERLVPLLDAQAWASDPWDAGHWVDCYASCLDANARHFGLATPVETLFDWLDRRCDPVSGLWGEPGQRGWLLPVNGFYRLTRGTYAQFGRPLPHPGAARATVWRHCHDDAVFGQGRGTACAVLDVVHPLWLCLRQERGQSAPAASALDDPASIDPASIDPASVGSGRVEAVTIEPRPAGLDQIELDPTELDPTELDQVEQWMERRLNQTLSRWSPGRGFAFDPEEGRPSLQGSEMWLSIVHLMAATLGLAAELGYRPRGVHRLDPPRRDLASG
ncbi:MAG: hypothetical protein LBK54_05280 [Propionibacteriaceae bacterium]|jgi:hypothetical protein|nr:hypothetical protein [Propionibacteriaceae bacterium]